MPCNTAHHYTPAIRAAATVPFLDMVASSAAQAASRAGPGGRVGILASPAVRLTKLFDAALARYGAEAIYPGTVVQGDGSTLVFVIEQPGTGTWTLNYEDPTVTAEGFPAGSLTFTV